MSRNMKSFIDSSSKCSSESSAASVEFNEENISFLFKFIRFLLQKKVLLKTSQLQTVPKKFLSFDLKVFISFHFFQVKEYRQ